MGEADTIDLCGQWSVRADPDRGGEAMGWPAAPPEGEEWRPITVPSAWQHVLGHDYHGVAWYAHTVRIPERWMQRNPDRQGRAESGGSRVWLEFEAVATEARVWVNGVEVGSHTGGCLAFRFDITAALVAGANAARRWITARSRGSGCCTGSCGSRRSKRREQARRRIRSW
jgi:beta-galactosidase/beta-glucuronidase